MRGRSGNSFCFPLTDKAPRPGEWKYMTQGGVGVADLLLMFTIFTNVRDSNVIQSALEMIANAGHSK